MSETVDDVDTEEEGVIDLEAEGVTDLEYD